MNSTAPITNPFKNLEKYLIKVAGKESIIENLCKRDIPVTVDPDMEYACVYAQTWAQAQAYAHGLE